MVNQMTEEREVVIKLRLTDALRWEAKAAAAKAQQSLADWLVLAIEEKIARDGK